MVTWYPMVRHSSVYLGLGQTRSNFSKGDYLFANLTKFNSYYSLHSIQLVHVGHRPKVILIMIIKPYDLIQLSNKRVKKNDIRSNNKTIVYLVITYRRSSKGLARLVKKEII